MEVNLPLFCAHSNVSKLGVHDHTGERLARQKLRIGHVRIGLSSEALSHDTLAMSSSHLLPPLIVSITMTNKSASVKVTTSSRVPVDANPHNDPRFVFAFADTHDIIDFLSWSLSGSIHHDEHIRRLYVDGRQAIFSSTFPENSNPRVHMSREQVAPVTITELEEILGVIAI